MTTDEKLAGEGAATQRIVRLQAELATAKEEHSVRIREMQDELDHAREWTDSLHAAVRLAANEKGNK